LIKKKVKQLISKGLNTNSLDEKHIYKVSELTEDIKFLLEDTFGFIWVEGEVSNFRTPHSGHTYFTLKDSLSEIRVVMFKNSFQKLRFDLKDGLQVLLYGKISVYEKRGEYQIIADYIEPKGIGALMLAFQQLKEKLAKEGLFDASFKKEIPCLPQRIGIITSLGGAAIKDILKVLKRRFYNLHLIIYPVKVQGEGAGFQIATAINNFNKLEEKIDVLIVARGGGSIEDLWAFNEEAVARAIFNSKIPVISAVGHERDYTISDMVADLRAATPSHGAEIVIERKDILRKNITSSVERMHRALESILKQKKERLRMLSGRYGLRRVNDIIIQYSQRLDELEERIKYRIIEIKDGKKQKFSNLIRRLEVLSPLNILSRGYSITFDFLTNKIIRDISQIEIGKKIKTRIFKGSFTSKVEEVKE
jgi:exodeoxyribonuclease VII large subunit